MNESTAQKGTAGPHTRDTPAYREVSERQSRWGAWDAARRGAAVSPARARGIKCYVMLCVAAGGGAREKKKPTGLPIPPRRLAFATARN